MLIQATDRKYDLEKRTLQFSKDIISLCKNLPRDLITRPLISQLVRSATSIGANYMEANGGSSKKDFTNKIFICKKEAKETMYWLDILENTLGKQDESITTLYNESRELVFIFSKIASSSRLSESV